MHLRHDISKQGIYGLFWNKKKRKTCTWYFTNCHKLKGENYATDESFALMVFLC